MIFGMIVAMIVAVLAFFIGLGLGAKWSDE